MSQFFFFFPVTLRTGEEKIESQVAEKKNAFAGKSKLGISYLSVIHYFRTWVGSASVSFFCFSWPAMFLFWPQRETGGERRANSQETRTSCFIRRRCVPPRSTHLNMMAGSRKGLAKGPMWPPGVLYIGAAAASGPPGWQEGFFWTGEWTDVLMRYNLSEISIDGHGVNPRPFKQKCWKDMFSQIF